MTELKYEFSKLDKTHCYYLAEQNIWIWFYIGKYLTAAGNNFILYPYTPQYNLKKILVTKVNSAETKGKLIAKKINKHFLKVSKKPIKL